MDQKNPTARALVCLSLLQEHPGMTGQRLGERLGVSPRAARRYVATLREAGIAVESVPGRHGGYRLGQGRRQAPLLFSSGEALGLVMAVLDGHHAAADATDPVGSALGKLLRVLPPPVARQAEAVRRRAATAPDRAAARPDPRTASALVDASGDQRRLRLGYRTEAGSELTVEVDPWAVVVRHGRWYLLCWSDTAQERRAYRVDRVHSVSLLDTSFTPPDDLDPVADLEAHLAVGWEYDVEVLIDAPLSALRLPRTLGRLEVVGDDATRLVGSTSNPWWYAEQLAALPAPYRIVGCDELRETARAVGRRLLDAAGPA